MRWGNHETTQTRQAFFDSVAPELVDAAVGRQVPTWSTPPRNLSGQFAFYADDDILAIASWPNATQVSADEALAWGLALAGDRDVVLILPVTRPGPTLQRLPWVSAPVKVFTFPTEAPDTVTPAIIPARAEVLAEVASWGQRGAAGPEKLGDVHAGWVAPLIEWVDEQLALAPRHRVSYLSWHAAGRQVLKIHKGSGGLSIEAGVRYTKPTADQPTPQPALTLQAALTPAQFVEIQATIVQAIERREKGDDAGHEEHRLQHAMEAKFNAPDELIGLAQLRREYPAWRPGQSPAYIDFLGAAADGTPHIVETKLDNDVMLAIQGLDYWIWATANPKLLAAELGTTGEHSPVIDFVVGAHKTTKAVGPYTLRQLEGLDGSIAWRFHVVRDWTTDLHIESLPPRQAPTPPTGSNPVTPPRYSQRLHQHLIEAAGQSLKGHGPFFHSPETGVLAEALPAWQDLQERGLLHRYAHHVRSSQIFALNLFGGLDDPARLALATLARIDDVETTSDIRFEFEDTTDLLREATLASPHRTQVDVAMDCVATDGTRTLLLIEVKLSELDFGHCSAYQSGANDRRDVCCTDGAFGSDPTNCFQLRNHDHDQRRTYDLHLCPALPTANGCAFRLGTNQPMRNVALGRALIDAGAADAVVFALAAPRANVTIWRRWREAKAALDDIPNVRLAALSADLVVTIHEANRATVLARRYQLHTHHLPANPISEDQSLENRRN